MKTLLHETRELIGGQICCTLDYTLLAQMQGAAARFGVSVKNEQTGETAEVMDVTGDRQQAVAFFKSVVRGQVTPVTLREVAEDFVAR